MPPKSKKAKQDLYTFCFYIQYKPNHERTYKISCWMLGAFGFQGREQASNRATTTSKQAAAQPQLFVLTMIGLDFSAVARLICR